MERRIGILGGTFNPIHNGHISLAQTALKELDLDTIWFMPSGQTNLKKEMFILPAKARSTLIELAIEKFDSFKLSTIEIERSGITYTFETLLQLEEMFPEDSFFFILGADCLFSIEKWKEPTIIMDKTTLVSAVRGEDDISSLKRQADYLRQKYNAQIHLLNFPAITVSSTEIRSKIANNESVKGLIPIEVEEYIKEHFLYKGMENA
ncbi:MAG: nicotinate-nucleotide adenylyltransferase [Lachnospiraceae bacterium]|nr:nicotinate-nucleotide adenylyltransferase [Lachnospiraceae bacterium]